MRKLPLILLLALALAGCLPDKPDESWRPPLDRFQSAVRDKELDKAKELEDEILKNPDTRLETFYHLHDCYAKHNEPQRAIAVMERILKVRPELGELDRARIWQSVGADEFALGHNENAAAAYEKAMALDKHNPIIQSDYAIFLVDTGGDLEKARQLARQAVSQHEGDPMLLDTLGWVVFRSGQKELALEYFISALQVDANQPELQLHAAMAFEATGNKDRAVKFYMTCVDVGSMYPKVEETAKARLKNLDPVAYAKATTVKRRPSVPDTE